MNGAQVFVGVAVLGVTLAAAEQQEGQAERDVMAAGDVVSIQFPHRADFNQEVVLRTDGRISLPLVGTIQAVGLTPEALEQKVRDRLAKLAYDPAGAVSDKRYLININDLLDIRFQNTPNLNATVRVRPDGRISLDLVKTVVAEGKTPEELEAELIRLYSASLQNSDLVVVVREFTSQLVSIGGRLVRPGVKDLDDAVVVVQSYAPRQVYIAGEVRAPGFVAYRRPLTAMQAIIAAGGPLRSAANNRVLLLRKSGPEPPSATLIDLEADLKGRGSNDVSLQPFDIVIVPMTKIASINQALDQYVYQLIPATRNVNFTFFYELGDRVP